MDPNVEDAEQKREQADTISNTAADVGSQGNGDAAVDLEDQAAQLRSEADQEEDAARAQAEQEKANIDEKYGTG